MLSRAAVLITAALLLSGCATGDLDGLLSFDDTKSEAPPMAAPTVVAGPIVDQDEEFCRGAAESDGDAQARLGNDPAQQRRVAEQSFQQCISRSGNLVH